MGKFMGNYLIEYEDVMTLLDVMKLFIFTFIHFGPLRVRLKTK